MGELQDSGLAKKATDQEEIARECDALEEELAATRAAYEQYFLGIERQAPTVRYNALKKRMLRLKTAFVRQTALKFKISSLHNKFSTYERLWQKTLQEIENGTYKRDLFKARMHAKKREQKPAPAAASTVKPETPLPQTDEEIDGLISAFDSVAGPTVPNAKPPPVTVAAAAAGAPPGLKPSGTPQPPGLKPAGTPQPGAAARPAGTPPPMAAKNGSPGAISDAKLRAVYDAYVTAKRRCNEDVSKLDFNAVAASLKKQVPELMKKHNAKSVDFKVVIKDGKAVLRAVPRE